MGVTLRRFVAKGIGTGIVDLENCLCREVRLALVHDTRGSLIECIVIIEFAPLTQTGVGPGPPGKRFRIPNQILVDRKFEIDMTVFLAHPH